MDYCLADGDGGATMFAADPAIDTDGDHLLDGVLLDLDGDGLFDDALTDTDTDGLADHAVLDVGPGARTLTDDGSGTWAGQPGRSPGLRWFGLDGSAGQPGGPLVDVDGDGAADDRLFDTDGDGLADRVVTGRTGLADTDGDGHWDVRLTDTDGDGAADTAGPAGTPP